MVKGIRFQNLRDAGDPADQAGEYERQGADEIVILDIGASAEARDTQRETVRAVRRRIHIPLTVGGGVRSVDDARGLLAAGADKVSVNTAAVRDPSLLERLSQAFGTQCVVLAIDARRLGDSWDTLVVGGREATGIDAIEWAAEGTRLGAGEILLTVGIGTGRVRAATWSYSKPCVRRWTCLSSRPAASVLRRMWRRPSEPAPMPSWPHRSFMTVTSPSGRSKPTCQSKDWRYAHDHSSIDLMDGRAVQLRQGKEFVLDGGDPFERLEEFSVAGEVAVVDLDAAMGKGSNAPIIRELVRQAPCRVGGGIRDIDAALAWLDAGAERVVIGTAASADFCSQLPRDRVVAAVDAEGGRVVVEGCRPKPNTA